LTFYLAFIVVYSLGLMTLGIVIGRHVRASGDFFVAGRRLGPGLLFATLLAANIGAGSTVGATGLGYQYGLAAWWWVGSAAIGSLALAFVIGPRMRREAERLQLKTVGEYLERRYNGTVAGGISALLWIGTLSILAGQLIGIGSVLRTILGVPHGLGALIGGALIGTYFVSGGLASSVWVHVVQLTIKMVGFALALPLAMHDAGGWGRVLADAPADPAYWSAWQHGAIGWPLLFMLAPAFVVSPGVLQKVYGARDDRAVRWGVGLNALGLFAFALVPVLLGMIARVLHPDLPSRDVALPTVLTLDLPPAIGALGLAALFSAELSAADAVLFMLSTSLSQDLYRRYWRPDAGDRQVLTVARLAAVFGLVAATGFAVLQPTVTDALSIFYSLLTVSLFVPIVAGLCLPKTRTVDAGVAIVCGVAALVAGHWLTGGKGIGYATPSILGLGTAIASFCVSYAAGRLLTPRTAEGHV